MVGAGERGAIVDEQGQPVDQVLVNIDRTYYLWHADANYPEYSTQLVAADRTFQIGPVRAQQLTFTFKKPGYVEQKITVKQGIEQKLAKQIAARIKEAKIKVDTQINGDKLRVNGKKRDDLQAAIALLRGTEFELPLQFDNFRD